MQHKHKDWQASLAKALGRMIQVMWTACNWQSDLAHVNQRADGFCLAVAEGFEQALQLGAGEHVQREEARVCVHGVVPVPARHPGLVHLLGMGGLLVDGEAVVAEVAIVPYDGFVQTVEVDHAHL